ncbi:MAG: proline dehydrogenase family protein [Chitinophagaceae bacterium]|nr:proline dehydrogenase family protein [Chitinophagaceae bacterium]
MNFDNTEIAFASKSNQELKKARFLFSSMGRPWLTRLGISLTQFGFRFHLPIKGVIKSTIFDHFCGGETLEEADRSAKLLDQYGVSVIMDYGVEGKSNEAEFEKTAASFLKTIQFSANKSYIPFISLKVTGFARFELLEKIHANQSLTPDEEQEAGRVMARIDSICAAAEKAGKMILIDAEESWIQQGVDDLADHMMEKYNRGKVVVFNTFQLYRHDRLEFLKKSFDKAQAGNYQLGAKLVRGAYMEKERFRAAQYNYPSPIQPDKAATDRDYDLASDFCLQNLDQIVLFVGTHNERSCQLAFEKMQSLKISLNTDRVYFSQLYGMSDNISFNLAKAGCHVSKYLPYGPVEDVIPYLMRRAQENTSVAGQTGRELSLIQKELQRRALS